MDPGAGQRETTPAATAPGAKKRSVEGRIGIALAIVVAATVCGWISVSGPAQGVVTLLGIVTAVTLVGVVGLPRWSERLWPMLVLAFVAIGTALIAGSVAMSPYGVIAILLAVTVFPVYAVTAWAHLGTWAQDRPPPPPLGRRTVALALVSGAMFAATGLGFMALLAGPSKVVTDGQLVTVSIGERCRVSTNDALQVTSATCPDSRWTIDGQTYRGTVHIGAGELDFAVDRSGEADLVFRNRTIEAYAIPGNDDAYTAGSVGNINGGDVFAVVPWWFTFATPLLIVVLIIRAIVRAIRRRASPSAS